MYKDIKKTFIGSRWWQGSSLNHYVYSFPTDLVARQKSFEESLKKMASNYLSKLKKMQSKLHNVNMKSSEITLFDSLRKIIATYFNVSQSLKNLDKKSLLNIRTKLKCNRCHLKKQLKLISNDERAQHKLIEDLRQDVLSKENDYKHAHKGGCTFLKQLDEKKYGYNREMVSNGADLVKLQQHKENIKVKRKFYLDSLTKCNSEVDCYNDIRVKSNLCNYKMFFEDLFHSMKDVIHHHQKVLDDQMEVYKYLQEELKGILSSVDPIKDAETIFNFVYSEINYERKIDEKICEELLPFEVEDCDV